MPKRTPRLILAGGAKDRTNASGGVQIDEPEPLKPYNP
jgi:hypothetical protein